MSSLDVTDVLKATLMLLCMHKRQMLWKGCDIINKIHVCLQNILKKKIAL